MSQASEFTPARIIEVELAQRLPDRSAFGASPDRKYRRAIALVRLHTQPLGTLEIGLGEEGVSADALARQIERALRSEITAHLRQDGLPEIAELTAAGMPCSDLPKCVQTREAVLDNPPFVSIIVATRDRTASLAACLNSLLSVDYPHYEIVVVDNAPSTSATADFIRQTYGGSTQVRYVREDQPGLAIAHNRGLAEVQSPIVAFTDDDVTIDTYWLAELVSGFNVADDVACVTGLIFPAELEMPVQEWLERFSLSKGFARRVFDLSENRLPNPLYPYTAGVFGSGANMAFKRSFLREIGGFDPALGAGTDAMGGDDLATFFEVVTRGYKLVYQPAALVHHWHRRDYAGLRRQVYGYGVGLTAYLTKTLIDQPGRLPGFIARVPYGLAHALSLRAPEHAERRTTYPDELRRLERKGMLAGPFAYLRSRWKSRRMKQLK